MTRLCNNKLKYRSSHTKKVQYLGHMTKKVQTVRSPEIFPGKISNVLRFREYQKRDAIASFCKWYESQENKWKTFALWTRALPKWKWLSNLGHTRNTPRMPSTKWLKIFRIFNFPKIFVIPLRIFGTTVIHKSIILSLIHIWRCRRSTLCRSRWSPYH